MFFAGGCLEMSLEGTSIDWRTRSQTHAMASHKGRRRRCDLRRHSRDCGASECTPVPGPLWPGRAAELHFVHASGRKNDLGDALPCLARGRGYRLSGRICSLSRSAARWPHSRLSSLSPYGCWARRLRVRFDAPQSDGYPEPSHPHRCGRDGIPRGCSSIECTSSTMKCNTWARGVSAVRCGDDAQTLPTLVCG